MLLIAAFIALATSASASDADPLDALSKADQNPIAHHITVPMEADYDFKIGSFAKTQYTLKVQPVMPIPLGDEWNVIVRTIFPMRGQPQADSATGGTFGLQDTLVSFFLSPEYAPGGLSWGIGPALQIPTATSTSLGTGKWSLGPTFALMFQPTHWTLGFLVNNIWSFAGSPDREAVDQFQLQYFFQYRFSSRWFVSCSPTSSANWKAAPGDQWTVPVGGGGGKIFKVGQAALSVKAEAYYNVVRPQNPPSPSWQLRTTVTLVFPKAL